MPVPLIITRPAGSARAWQAALQPHLPGTPCHVLPLITIAPVAASQIQPCWQALAQWHAAVFVSPAAVEHFFAAQEQAAQLWLAHGLRAWAVGPGTRRALLQVGIPACQIDSPPDDASQFDSEALWPHIQPQLAACLRSGKRILRVRGTDHDPHGTAAFEAGQGAGHEQSAGSGRDWLGAAIRQAGVGVDSVAAYCRQPPAWQAQQARAARALAEKPAVWLFSSSLAVRYLARQFPDGDWAHAHALTTHARIARQAQALGFGRVLTCRPTVQDVLRSVAHSLQSCP